MGDGQFTQEFRENIAQLLTDEVAPPMAPDSDEIYHLVFKSGEDIVHIFEEFDQGRYDNFDESYAAFFVRFKRDVPDQFSSDNQDLRFYDTEDEEFKIIATFTDSWGVSAGEHYFAVIYKFFFDGNIFGDYYE